jgi:hypothetical protein
MTSSSRSDDVASIVARHDPAAYSRPIARWSDADLPFDPAAMPADLPVMLDTNFYIARLKGKLTAQILNFVDGRQVLHSGIACSELAIRVGILTPGEPTTPTYRDPIMNLLATVDLAQTVSERRRMVRGGHDCRHPGARAASEQKPKRAHRRRGVLSGW